MFTFNSLKSFSSLYQLYTKVNPVFVGNNCKWNQDVLELDE